MINEIQKVMDILLKEFDYVYCDTCKYYDTDSCDDCHRKYINWALSVNTARRLAEEIIEAITNK